MEMDHTTQPTKKRRLGDTLNEPTPSHENDQEDEEMEEQNQHCSKDDNGLVNQRTNLMSASSSSSTPKILTSSALEKYHPDKTLTPDAELVVNQLAKTFIAAVKMSKVEGEIFTLPIVKSCIASCLQGCEEGLLKYAESEGSKAFQKFASPKISTTRADQLKKMEEQQKEELEEMEKELITQHQSDDRQNKELLAMEVITQQQFDDRQDENKRKLLDYPLSNTLYSQINETKLNALIKELLEERNKSDAENVINLDFAKYGLTPNDETKQLMSRAEELATMSNAEMLSYQSVVTLVFQATGHTINDEALVYLAAVVEYLMAEILELSGNNASDNKRKIIHPSDIKIIVPQDEELLRLWQENLNLNQFEYWTAINGFTNTAQLISGRDNKVTQLSLTRLLSYWQGHNSVFHPSRIWCVYDFQDLPNGPSFSLLSELNWSSPTGVAVIVPNTTTSGRCNHLLTFCFGL